MNGVKVNEIMKVPQSQEHLPKAEQKATRRFIYEIFGTKDELVAFKKAQGDFYRESTDSRKVPVLFSTKNYGVAVEFGISAKGNVFSKDNVIENLQLFAVQYPDQKKEIDKQIAGILFARASGKPVSAPVAVTEDTLAIDAQ